MKKILTLMLAAGMLLGAASGAKAIDFKASGEWLVGFGLGDGSLIKDVDNKKYHHDDTSMPASASACSWMPWPPNPCPVRCSSRSATRCGAMPKKAAPPWVPTARS